MHALFVANIELNENEGIYKKVVAEASAINAVLGSCDLITRFDGKAKVRYADGQTWSGEKTVLDYVKACIDEGKVDFLYIRHMIPSPKLISLLKSAKKRNICIYYEIPTYPYFGEQFKASRRKHRAIIKIGLDIIFWPLIYKNIDKLVVIRSSTKAKEYSKMIEITNGVRVDNIQEKTYTRQEPDVFRMVAVGTLFPYHGYDRILRGMASCNEKIENIRVEFHVVGSSQTIDDLHRTADTLKLKNVFFHGIKSTEELNEMYEKFDVGLGCLALHRRNANIDTTLKIIEYYCRGVPVVSSGITPMDNINKQFTIHVDDSETPIDISKLYNQYLNISMEEKKDISKVAKNVFSWNSIMKKILKDKGKND